MKINETKNKLPKYIISVDSLYNWQCIVLLRSIGAWKKAFNFDCNIIENISHGLFQ